MGRVRFLAFAVLAVLTLTACRIDTTVAVHVDDDGSGTVSVRVAFDAGAVHAAEAGGSSIEERVRLDDLEASGWRVTPWRRTQGGAAVLRLAHSFASPADMETVIAELSGADGPLRAELERGAELARTEFRFRGVADLASATAGVSGDSQLAANLAGQRVDVTAIDAELTDRLREALRMQVAVSLPGNGTRTWKVPAGGRRVLATSSTILDAAKVAWIGLGLVLGAGALMLVLVGARRARRRRSDPEPG